MLIYDFTPLIHAALCGGGVLLRTLENFLQILFRFSVQRQLVGGQIGGIGRLVAFFVFQRNHGL